MDRRTLRRYIALPILMLMTLVCGAVWARDVHQMRLLIGILAGTATVFIFPGFLWSRGGNPMEKRFFFSSIAAAAFLWMIYFFIGAQ